MIDSIPGALPEVTHPPAAPNAGKPKGAEEENKFAHQVKELMVKEQQEAAKSDKVKDENKKENKKDKQNKKDKSKQDISKKKENLPIKKGGNNDMHKGIKIDVEA